MNFLVFFFYRKILRAPFGKILKILIMWLAELLTIARFWVMKWRPCVPSCPFIASRWKALLRLWKSKVKASLAVSWIVSLYSGETVWNIYNCNWVRKTMTETTTTTTTTTIDRAIRPPHMTLVKRAAQFPRSRLTALLFQFKLRFVHMRRLASYQDLNTRGR